MARTDVFTICKVFISYTAADHEFASKLRDKIERNQMQAFMYEHTKAYGQNIESKITSNLQTADYVVALITRNGISSASVNQELGYSRALEIPFIPMCRVDKHDQSYDNSKKTNKMPKPYDVRDLLGVFTYGRERAEFTDLEDFSTECDRIIEYMKSNGSRYLLTPEMQMIEKTSRYRGDIRNTVTSMVMIIVGLFEPDRKDNVGYAEYPDISDLRKWQDTFKDESDVKDMLQHVTLGWFLEFAKNYWRLHIEFLDHKNRLDRNKMLSQEKFMINEVYNSINSRFDNTKIELPDMDKIKHLKFVEILKDDDESRKLDLQLSEISTLLSGLMRSGIKLLSVIRQTEDRYGNEILWNHRREHMYDV